jgi:predicted nucleic-acid-binding protein
MLAVDTNVVVRYLVKDDDAQSARTRDARHCAERRVASERPLYYLTAVLHYREAP